MELNRNTLPAYLDVLQREKGVKFYNYTPKFVDTAGMPSAAGVGDSISGIFAGGAGQPAFDMQTLPSGGIPAVASQVIYPVIYQVLFAPLTATKFYSERQATTGWARDDELFPRTEEGYEIAGYSDKTRTGSTHINVNFERRQQARFEIMNEWGDLEQQRYGEARIPYVAYKQQKSIEAIRRFFNTSYIYGILGKQTFGFINDPALPAAIAPEPTADGKTEWKDKDAIGIYNDFITLFSQLAATNRGLIDTNSRMKLGVGPSANAYMSKVNALGTDTALSLINKTYPNIEVNIIPEFDTESGGLVQLKAEDLGGTPVGECVFGQKLLSFPVIVIHSQTEQKLAAGTFGTVIYRPSAVAQMIGVGVNPNITGKTGII